MQFCIYWLLALLMAIVNGHNAIEMGFPNVTLRDTSISLSLTECGDLKYQSVCFFIELEKNCIGNFVQAMKPSLNDPIWTAKYNLTTKLQPNVQFRISTLIESNGNVDGKVVKRILNRISEYRIDKHGVLQKVMPSTATAKTTSTRDSSFTSSSSYRNEIIQKCIKENAISDNCNSIETILADGKQPKSINEMIFDATFHNNYKLDEYWSHESRSVHRSPTKEMVAFGRHKNNTYLYNNKLHLKATETEKSHEFKAENCTSRETNTINWKYECGPIKISLWKSVAPAQSSKIYTKFAFKYGRIEFRAQMADGDWLYPYILLQPFDSHVEDPYASQIRLAYTHGNAHLYTNDNKQLNNKVLFGGVLNWNKGIPVHTHTSRVSKQSYANGFNNFTVIWHPDRIIYKVNGNDYGQITDKEALKAFQKPCFIVLGLTVHGIANFPDDIKNEQKPFITNSPQATLQFKEQMKSFDWRSPKLMIEYIRVYATYNKEN